MLQKYVRSDLGYKGFKIYQHKSGSLFNDANCILLWNNTSIEELKKYGLESGRIDVYVDNGSNGDEVEESARESEKDDERQESAGESDKDDESEDSSFESEYADGSEKSVEEDSEDKDYNVNHSDFDNEWNELMQKKKCMHTVNNVEDKQKEVHNEDIKGWESEYDSDSYKIGKNKGLTLLTMRLHQL